MAVYTTLSKKDADSIAKRWRLGKPKKFEGIAKGSVNTNYRLVTDTGTYFVRLDETRGVEEVEAETRLTAFLATRGFPTPEPLPDSKGKTIVELKEKPLAIFPWMQGKDFAAEEYGLRELAAAGEMLARMHHAAKGYGETLRNRFGRAATAARWWRIRKKADVPDAHRKEIDEALATHEPPPAGARGIVHGDWFADNLLFESGVIVGVLDFEAAATDDLTFDVATAVNALCWKKQDPDRFDKRRVVALLDGYDEANGPASLEDDALGFWLRATAVRFVVTRIQDFRMKKSSLRVEKDYRDFLRRLRFWTEKPFRRT